MKLVCISDTHGLHERMIVPHGDVLIHAGDFTERGESYEATAFLRWLASQPHRHKVFIAGNHEFYCEEYPEEFAQQVAQYPDVHFLCDSGVTLEGVAFWGSPFTPRFYDWAFNCDRGPDIQTHWDAIARDTQVLVTHGPPHGVGDINLQGSHEGCENLRDTVARMPQLRLHVCGHIHFGYGRYQIDEHQMVNASVLNERYELANLPIVFEFPIPSPGGPTSHFCE